MYDQLQPILPMTRLVGLCVNVAATRLSIGDALEARLQGDGRVGIFAPVRRRLLGLIPRSTLRLLGHLAPAAGGLIAPALQTGTRLRVRIVGLTPEHLAPEPEVHVSVWGVARAVPSKPASRTPPPFA